MASNVKQIGTKISNLLRTNIWQFLLIHGCYIALGLILFAPLLGILSRLMLRLSATPVLADMDILFFILSPVGLIALVLFGSLLITILIFEQASMMTAYTALGGGLKADLFQTLRRTASKSLKIFIFSVHLVARLLLIVTPFLAVAFLIYWLTLTDYDINYYLSAQPPIFFAAAGAIGLILLILTLILVRKLLSWSLTLPLIIFTEVTPGASFQKSFKLVADSKKAVALILVGWALATLVLGFLVLGSVQLLGRHILPMFYSSMNALIIVIGFLAALLTVGNFLVTALTAASFSGLLIELYKRAGQRLKLDEFSARSESSGLRLTSKTLVGLLVCGTVVSILVGLWLIQGIQTTDDLTIVAHRGAAGKAPENTMASIRQAVEDQTDWVEIDVQETADGEVIVIHDSDFMKLSGVGLKVWEGTLEQVQQIDVGSWFGPAFAGERVPTLRDVLKELRGRAKLVIELKYYGHDEQLEQRVVDLVEEMGMVEDTAIMSLKYDAVEKVRSLRPDWKTGLLSAQVLGDMSGLDVDFLAVNAGMAGPAFIRHNQQAGKQVFVWTVNDKMSMFKMMSLGVDGIITDEPELARQVIAERAELNSVERLLIHAAVILGKSLPQKSYRDNSP